MAIKVAINGFGRIGRLTFRNLMERGDEFEIVGEAFSSILHTQGNIRSEQLLGAGKEIVRFDGKGGLGEGLVQVHFARKPRSFWKLLRTIHRENQSE